MFVVDLDYIESFQRTTCYKYENSRFKLSENTSEWNTRKRIFELFGQICKLSMNIRNFYFRLFWENLTPDARRPVSFIDDAELAYIMRRYREIHDLTHVTLGMPINMLGRIFFFYLQMSNQ